MRSVEVLDRDERLGLERRVEGLDEEDLAVAIDRDAREALDRAVEEAIAIRIGRSETFDERGARIERGREPGDDVVHEPAIPRSGGAATRHDLPAVATTSPSGRPDPTMPAMNDRKRPNDPGRTHCVLCGNGTHEGHRHPVRRLRPELISFLGRLVAPRAIEDDARICRSCLTDLRTKQVLEQLEAERGALTELEREVAEKAAAHATVATNLTESLERDATFGQRIADVVARVGGSWPFVISFLCVLAIWMATNSYALRGKAFDPYPYILLNLVLSCIAALQAPIIMMSQNRTAKRDRKEADLDFRVNLKSELEIGALHDKIDHLLHSQWEELITLQQTQLDLLEELAARRGERDSSPEV